MQLTTLGLLPGQFAELTADFATVDASLDTQRTPHMSLLPHQKAVVRAMCDIEDSGKMLCFTPAYDRVSISPVEIRSSAMVLADPYGSGKMIEVISLCLLRRIPSALGDQELIHAAREIGARTLPPGHLYHKIDDHSPRFIFATLILVHSRSWDAWVEAIRAVQILRCIYVARSEDLGDLSDPCNISCDVVLCKITRNLLGDIREKTEGKVWSRVIYDDFDIFPGCARAIPAFFSIFVSATGSGPKKPRGLYDDHPDYLWKAQQDKILFTNFTVKTSQEFLQQSTGLSPVITRNYLDNNSTNRLSMLITQANSREISSLLAADKLHEAAHALHIQHITPEGIIHRLLGSRYNHYVRIKRVADFLEGILSIETAKTESSWDLAVSDVSDVADVSDERWMQILSAVTKGDPTPAAIQPGLYMKVQAYLPTVIRQLDRISLAINRVRQGIAADICEVCLEPLSSPSVIGVTIMKCCGTILCSVCSVKANRMSPFEGLCCHCKKKTRVTDLIYVDSSFDLTLLADSRLLPRVERPEVTTWDQCFVGIIMGDFSGGCVMRSSYKNIIGVGCQGHISRDDYPTSHPKIIAVIPPQMADRARQLLTTSRISFGEFDHSTKKAIVRKFYREHRVLLVTRPAQCDDLDLEFVTDIIFGSLTTDEAKIIGRCQRIGRTVPLCVHHIIYPCV